MTLRSSVLETYNEDAMRDFGRVDLLEPEAIGEPGKRTFRLRILRGPEAASLWLEKEQLAALTLALRQLLEQTGGAEDDTPAAPPSRTFPLNPDVDFKIGRLGLGYDEQERLVVIFAYDLDAEEDEPPTFSCRVTLRQCETFADQAEEVINAGRPICLLCGGPIDPEGHRCPRRNGHGDVPISQT